MVFYVMIHSSLANVLKRAQLGAVMNSDTIGLQIDFEVKVSAKLVAVWPGGFLKKMQKNQKSHFWLQTGVQSSKICNNSQDIV